MNNKYTEKPVRALLSEAALNGKACLPLVMEPSDPGKPKRRVRYKGTHPKRFEEKYKEHQPEKYAQEVEKVKSRGQTPAGSHVPIMVEEILKILSPQPGETGYDATLGYGGHTSRLLACIAPGGMIFAGDVDPVELPKTEARLRAAGWGPEILQIRQLNFAGIDSIAAEAGPLNFVLADLGVSSMQLDDPARGFSYKIDGPLDLRLNPAKGKPVSAFLKDVNQDQLEELLQENADEPYARQIARQIAGFYGGGGTLTGTLQLKELIAATLSRLPERTRADEIKKACQRTFQALRIAVNHEFQVLERFLEHLPFSLAPGGRVAILSFHSGEDRRVKKSFQHYFREGAYQAVADGPERPTKEEINKNPRSKSAKLRWAIRQEHPE